MAIACCYGCVPPKRTTTCKFDGTCNKYAEEKAEHDKLKAKIDLEKSINIGICMSRSEKVYKAMKDRRHKKV